MELGNALPDNMDAFAFVPIVIEEGFIGAVAEASQVVCQGIEPHIDDFITIGNVNAPATRPFRAARNADVGQSAPQQGKELVAPMGRNDLERVGLDKLQIRLPYRDSRKNQFSSLTFSRGTPCSGHRPSSSHRAQTAHRTARSPRNRAPRKLCDKGRRSRRRLATSHERSRRVSRRARCERIRRLKCRVGRQAARTCRHWQSRSLRLAGPRLPPT